MPTTSCAHTISYQLIDLMPVKMVIPKISAELPEPLVDPFGYATHEVFNQPPRLDDYDAFGTDEVLKTIVRTFGAESYQSRLHEAASP